MHSNIDHHCFFCFWCSVPIGLGTGFLDSPQFCMVPRRLTILREFGHAMRAICRMGATSQVWFGRRCSIPACGVLFVAIFPVAQFGFADSRLATSSCHLISNRGSSAVCRHYGAHHSGLRGGAFEIYRHGGWQCLLRRFAVNS